MSRDNFYVGLDIGSAKIAVCIGTLTEQGVNIIGLSAVPHSGVRKGVITDLEETISAISHALEEAERMAGANVTHAYVAINGNHIEAQTAKGVVAVSRPNGEIDASDVERVVDAAKTATLPQNRELIHIFPTRFLIDGREEVRDPIGMSGIRLELDALIISSSAAATRNVTKAVFQAGLEIDGLVFGPLAAAKALTTKKQRESGVMVVDFGFGSTNLSVYEEGQLLHAACLPIGSMHITNDIAIGLRTNLEVAEIVKNKYGSALPSMVRESEQINLSTIDPGEGDKVSRRQVAEIIEARILEIFQMIKEELQSIGKDGLLPAGVVFTGGGSELDGLTELARTHLRLPAAVGYPVMPMGGIIDKIDSPIYATSVGLVLWALDEAGDKSAPWRPGLGKFGGVIDRFRGILKNFTN